MTTSHATVSHASAAIARDHAEAVPLHRRLAMGLDRLEARLYQRLRARREGQVGRFIAERGGVLTDELEREISRRFGRTVEW